MKTTKRFLAGLAAIALLSGCGYDGSPEGSRFAGTYTGTWVAVNNAADAGTSVWTISESGAVNGVDTDPTLGITYSVIGLINPQGQLSSTATPSNASGGASLNGVLQFETTNRLAGNLVWGVQQPATYRYVLNR